MKKQNESSTSPPSPPEFDIPKASYIFKTYSQADFRNIERISNMMSILKIIDASINILECNPNHWNIIAQGVTGTPNWSNPHLQPRYYINFPEDGLQDFDFMATPPGGMVIQILSPISTSMDWHNPPSYVKGIRVHSATNFIEILFDEKKAFCIKE